MEMNKIVRIIGLCALVALTFGSCNKNKTTTFTATSAEINSDSKTHLNGISVVWDMSDQILVTDNSGDSRTFVVSSLSTTQKKATFHVYDGDGDFMSNLETANSYSAYYPNADYDGNDVRIPVPAVQYYPSTQSVYNASANISPNTLPMRAMNDSLGAFTFTTDVGLLQIIIHRKAGATDAKSVLDSLVIVTRDGSEISGNIVYSNAGAYSFEGIGATVALVDRNPLPLPSTGEDRYYTFVLPKGTLSGGFYLKGYYHGIEVLSKTASIPSDNPSSYGEYDCSIAAGWIRTMIPLELDTIYYP